MRMTLALAAAVTALAAPVAAADLTPDLGDGERSGFWDDGLVLGVGAAGMGIAALAAGLYYLGVGGLRHVDRENVLDHPMRQSLLDVVEHEPGVHLRELANRHGTAVTNTQWHLRKLEMAGLVATRKVQGRRLYYPRDGGVAMRDLAIQNAALQNPNARRIIDQVESQPGINQRALAESLDMNPGTVRWHLRKMEEANLIRSVAEGAQNRYFLVQVQRPPRPPAQGRDAIGAVRDGPVRPPQQPGL